MQKNRSNASKMSESRNKNTIKNKQNPLSDAIYLIQNENEVLRMKNTELNEKIRELKAQLQLCSDNIVVKQLQINNIKSNIETTTFKEDIEIQNEKKFVMEKLAITKSNEQMLLRKIQEAREVSIFEQHKLESISHDKKTLEVEVLSLRAQNQGTKIILRNLQDQNERLKQQNEKLVNKRRIFEPKQRQLALQIEERIRLIKNQRNNLKTLRIYETSKLIDKILTIIYKKKLKEHLIKIDRYGLAKKLAKKKIIQVSLIRKKYINFIKNNILQIFRQSFKPLQEYETARRIIQDSRKRRAKFIIWRKWRKSSVQSVYTKTRRFETYNLFTKLEESFAKTLLFSAFNQIRYLKNKPHKQRGAIVIEDIFRNFMNRSKTFFFSNLKLAQQKHELDMQIDASSKEQSQLLLVSLYFAAWSKLTLTSRIQNKNIKRRYFKQLKKLLAIKKKRVLGEMLMNTNQRIKNMDIQAKIFSQLKKQSKLNIIQNNVEHHNSILAKYQSLKQQNQALHDQKKSLYKQLALIKISKYLKKKTQKAFDVWRLRKQQAKRLVTIINLVENKKSFDKNFAFCKILKKRFAMLKKSIRDKIQSCQFSYNYLLDQNKHIKEVLDKKQHELQKTKFLKLLQKIMKNQKQAKFKYFYKFLKNGYKYWKFRKTIQRIDALTINKLSMVFMWLLKQNINKIKTQQTLQQTVLKKQSKILLKLSRKCFNGFKECIKRNRRIKVVLRGIFDRNLQLDFYSAFGRIRNQQHQYNRNLIQQDIDAIQSEINKKNAIKAQQEHKTEILLQRLKDKQQTLQQRKILGLYKFFTKFIKIKFGSYIQRWHKRVKRENNVVQFAQILERKSSVLLKTKFLLTMNRKNQQYTISQYQNKFNKFKTQYDQAVASQEKFIKESDIQSKRMKQQNQINKKEGDIYEKRANHMTNVQTKSYGKAANKRMLGYCFKQWAQQKQIFKGVWGRINKYYQLKQLKGCYPIFIQEMAYVVHQFNLRRKLQKIYYNQHYLFNVALGFNYWRFTNLNKTNLLGLQEEKQMKKRFQGLEKKYHGCILKHDNQFKFRVYDSKTRKIFNVWRIDSQNRAKCKRDQQKLTQITWKAYCGEFIKLLKKKVNSKLQFKHKLNEFKQKWNKVRMLAFMQYTLKMKTYKKIFKHIFVEKYCPYLVHRKNEQFFSRVKNFNNTKEVNIKTNKTSKIQKVIQTFQKKRKDVLNLYLRKWRRNEYLMRIQFNLMRRITKNAMNWRVKDLFYSWKLQKQAKHVKQMHEEEGQVKKRKIQINRLKIFLQDFKKEKGLLLQNEGGQLVVSPRFQEKKQQQIKKDNNLRYKFISRVILAMNGYASPVKSYNNLRLYMHLREKYKKFALILKNKLRKPDLYYGFKTWQNANKKFNDMFQIIERKQLIKILNKQKDKMEMEYSKKIALIQKINEEMKVHKLLSHQEEKKEKLCVHVYLKNLRKIKTYALLTWKKRVQQMKEAQLIELQESGNDKINNLQDEVKQLQQMQREMRQNNQKLQMAVQQALQIAQMVRRITQQRDMLSNIIKQKELTCESLQQQNEQLNAKLYLAQKEAMNLLILSGERL